MPFVVDYRVCYEKNQANNLILLQIKMKFYRTRMIKRRKRKMSKSSNVVCTRSQGSEKLAKTLCTKHPKEVKKLEGARMVLYH